MCLINHVEHKLWDLNENRVKLENNVIRQLFILIKIEILIKITKKGKHKKIYNPNTTLNSWNNSFTELQFEFSIILDK